LEIFEVESNISNVLSDTKNAIQWLPSTGVNIPNLTAILNFMPVNDKLETPATCKGDSGGPMVCFVQHGIVSWGGKRCGKHRKAGVYAKVASVTSWIKKTTIYPTYICPLLRSSSKCKSIVSYNNSYTN